MAFVIDVVEMQERQNAGIGSLAPQMYAQIDRLQLLLEHGGGQALTPFVEVAEHDLRRVNPAIVHDRGKPLRLVAALAERRAEMHIEQMQRVVVVYGEVDALAAARLARFP